MTLLDDLRFATRGLLRTRQTTYRAALFHAGDQVHLVLRVEAIEQLLVMTSNTNTSALVISAGFTSASTDSAAQTNGARTYPLIQGVAESQSVTRAEGRRHRETTLISPIVRGPRPGRPANRRRRNRLPRGNPRPSSEAASAAPRARGPTTARPSARFARAPSLDRGDARFGRRGVTRLHRPNPRPTQRRPTYMRDDPAHRIGRRPRRLQMNRRSTTGTWVVYQPLISVHSAGDRPSGSNGSASASSKKVMARST